MLWGDKLKGNLTKKIIKRVLIITITINLLLTIYMSYAILDNYNKNIIRNLENINISSNIMFKSIRGTKEEVLKVIKDLAFSYGVQCFVIDDNNRIIIGDGDIFNNPKLPKSSTEVTIVIDNNITYSKATMSSPLYINNRYYGQLIIISDHTTEYSSTLFTIFLIIIAQVIVVVVLIRLISNYIKKSIEPLKVLKQGIIDYGSTGKLKPLDIRTNDEIEDLSNSFTNMVNEIELEKEKSNEFFNNVTHELKTPITSIWGYVQALSRKPITEIKPEFRNRAFERIGLESKKMISLIEKLLDISRDGVKSKVYDEEININEVLLTVKDRLKDVYKATIDIDSPEEVTIKANKDDINEIIKNLLENAAKYSSTDYVNVKVECVDTFVLVVENFIYEIPKDKKDRLMEPFIKYNPNLTENTEKKVSSSGLGLYLTKKLVEDNGLKISYEISDNKIKFIVAGIDI